MFRSTAQRQLEAREIAASARQFKVEVQRELETLLAAQLRDGETMPDLDLFQELIGRLLDGNGSRLVGIDTSYTGQLVSAAALRARRNELIVKLRQRLNDVRYLLERSVEGGVFKAALRDRRFSRLKPVLLVQSARDLVLALRNPSLAVGEGDSAILSTAASFADALEADANELETLLAQLSPQAKANQEGLGAKVADLQEAAEINRRCTSLLYGLYRVVRLDFHAERLRATVRRRASGEAEAPTAAEPVAAMVTIN